VKTLNEAANEIANEAANFKCCKRTITKEITYSAKSILRTYHSQCQ